MTTHSNVKLQAALLYATVYGLKVFPVHDVSVGICSCPKGSSCKEGGKHPRISAWQSNASKSKSQIERWWKSWPEANIGVPTGQTNGLFVIDIDDAEGQSKLEELIGELPTPTTFSARGMPHYWFPFPEGADITNRRGKVPSGIDVRGNGGFIIAPPSVSHKGTYQFNPKDSWSISLSEPSEKLLELLKPVVDDTKLVSASNAEHFDNLPRAQQAKYESYWIKAYEENIKKIENLTEGDEWNNTLYACSLRLFELVKTPWIPEDDMECVKQGILEACEGNYDNEGWDEERCKRTVTSAYRKALRDDQVVTEPAKPKPETKKTDKPKSAKEDWPPTLEREDKFREALRASFVNASDIKEIEEQTFLWEDWISSGELCLLAGDGGVGKGCFVTWLMAQLSNGTLPGKFEGKPARTVFVSTEEAYNRHTAPRLMAQNFDERYVTFIDFRKFEKESIQQETAEGLTLDKWKTKIMFEEFAKMDVSLVVFDPITGFLPDKTNQNDSMDVRNVLTPLNVYGQEYDITVIGIQHVNKGSSLSASDKVNGSTSWRNLARSGLYLAKNSNDEEFDRIANQLKGNYNAEQGGFTYRIESAVVIDKTGKSVKTQKFVRGNTVDTTADETVQKNSMTSKEASFALTAQTKAEVALVRMLKPLGMEGFNPSKGERSLFAKGVGVSVETLRKALIELISLGIAENTGKQGVPGVWRIVNEQAATQYLKTVESGMSADIGRKNNDLPM